eukprot:14951451-Alexandrium_andersonii.AAC.1
MRRRRQPEGLGGQEQLPLGTKKHGTGPGPGPQLQPARGHGDATVAGRPMRTLLSSAGGPCASGSGSSKDAIDAAAQFAPRKAHRSATHLVVNTGMQPRVIIRSCQRRQVFPALSRRGGGRPPRASQPLSG